MKMRYQVYMRLIDPVVIEVKIAVPERKRVDRDLVIQQQLKGARPSPLAGFQIPEDGHLRSGKVLEEREINRAKRS